MPVRGIALAWPTSPRGQSLIRAIMAEFFSMLIFVFASEGSVMAHAKLTGGDATTPSGLVAVAVAHALSLFVAVAVAINISGGHVNPAVTFGAMMAGHISILRAILYWIAQLLGAAIASLLLKFATSGRSTSPFAVSSGVGSWNAVVLEIVMTFGLVYTVYATAIDAKRGSLETIAPLAIGFIVGANILAGGVFDGAAMNPARAFGPAFVSGKWQYHWIYWVGPLIGGGLAGLLYEWLMVPLEPLHQPLQPDDY